MVRICFNRYTALIFFLFIVMPTAVFSDESEIKTKQHWYSGITIDLGVTLSQVDLDVDYYEDGSKVSGGTLSTDISYAPYISANSRYKYFGRTQFGYYYQLTFSGFKVDKQEIDGDDLEDVGTSAKGYFVYTMPVCFYNIGDKHFENGKGKSLKFGLGVGLGYLRAKGDIILENLDDGTQEKYSFDESTDVVDLAAYVMMDIRINKFLVRIRGGGPYIVNWENDGYEYSLFDFSMDLAYTFHL